MKTVMKKFFYMLIFFLNKIPNLEVSDTTEDDSSNQAKCINIFKLLLRFTIKTRHYSQGPLHDSPLIPFSTPSQDLQLQREAYGK